MFNYYVHLKKGCCFRVCASLHGHTVYCIMSGSHYFLFRVMHFSWDQRLNWDCTRVVMVTGTP